MSASALGVFLEGCGGGSPSGGGGNDTSVAIQAATQASIRAAAQSAILAAEATYPSRQIQDGRHRIAPYLAGAGADTGSGFGK